MDSKNGTGNTVINCSPKQPEDNNEPYIFELKRKKLPFSVTLSTDYLQSRPDLLEQLRNNIVQTIPIPNVSEINREVLKGECVQSPDRGLNKNAEVTSDSYTEKGGEIARKYCIPHSPITVISNKSELTLVERNKVVTLEEPNEDVMVLTPSPRQPLCVFSDQSMSSASSIKKRRKRKNRSKGSDDSTSSNGKSSSSSEGSDHEHQNMDINQNDVEEPHPLQKELLSRNSFDNLDTYKDYFEHAYSECGRARGAESCHLTSACKGPETKGYVEREIENITAATSLDENENHKHIVYTLFHHSMSCNITPCYIPLCSDFKKAMNEILRKSGPDLQHLNSTCSCPDLMKVVYSNTSHFDEYNEDGTGKEVMEGCDFKFLYENYINKGSFGYVYDTWMTTDKGQTRIAVKKSGKNFSTQHLDIKIEPFLALGKAPNLLFPDVILSSQGGLNYFIMEKAEMSMSVYWKRKFETHKKNCPKADHFTGNGGMACNGGLDPILCSLYFYQMAQGLKYLHGHGYTHGDIKPDNVLIMPGFQEVKLCDFDFLKNVEEQMPSGTRGYEAPEVRDPSFKNVVKSSDVYSLCCCLPEMLLAFRMNAKRKDDFLKERTAVLVNNVYHMDQHLGVIFEHGMHWDYKARPSVDLIVECFERNEEMRQRKLTVVGMEVPAYRNPENADTTLSRKILDKWIHDIMNQHLRQSLPPIMPDYDLDDNFNMEIMDVVEDSTEDIPLAMIFQEGMSAISMNSTSA